MSPIRTGKRKRVIQIAGNSTVAQLCLIIIARLSIDRTIRDPGTRPRRLVDPRCFLATNHLHRLFIVNHMIYLNIGMQTNMLRKRRNQAIDQTALPIPAIMIYPTTINAIVTVIIRHHRQLIIHQSGIITILTLIIHRNLLIRTIQLSLVIQLSLIIQPRRANSNGTVNAIVLHLKILHFTVLINRSRRITPTLVHSMSERVMGVDLRMSLSPALYPLKACSNHMEQGVGQSWRIEEEMLGQIFVPNQYGKKATKCPLLDLLQQLLPQLKWKRTQSMASPTSLAGHHVKKRLRA